MSRKSLLVGVTALVVSLSMSLAGANMLVFNNFTDTPGELGYPYNDPVTGFGIQWHGVSGPGGFVGVPYGNTWAMPFTNNTGIDVPLHSISLAMYKVANGAAPNLTIRLVQDNGSTTAQGSLPLENPANTIEVLAVDPVIAEDKATFLNLTSSLQPILENGKTYWVLLTSPEPPPAPPPMMSFISGFKTRWIRSSGTPANNSILP